MSSVTMLPQAGLALLEGAINTALALDPETLARLGRLEGKVIAVELEGAGVTLFLLPDGRGFRLMGHYEGEPDTRLRGTPLALLRLNGGKPGEGLFSGAVKIEGDVELGQRVQRILGGLDIDWEEHLSRLTGDVVAHQIGNAVRGLLRWSEQAAASLGRGFADHVQEERRDLPPRWEVEEFLAGVDELRSAVDRLEARLRRLEQGLNK
jgi:ubiquinone biosynthesis protein UbiJ